MKNSIIKVSNPHLKWGLLTLINLKSAEMLEKTRNTKSWDI